MRVITPFTPFIAGVALLLVTGASPARESGEAGDREIYADIRSYVFENPEPLDGGGARVAARASVGLRLNRVLGQAWMLEADARATLQYRDGALGSGRSDAFVEIKRLYVHGEELFGHPFLTLCPATVPPGRKRGSRRFNACKRPTTPPPRPAFLSPVARGCEPAPSRPIADRTTSMISKIRFRLSAKSVNP